MPKAATQQHIQHMLSQQALIGITKLMLSTVTELSHTRKAIVKMHDSETKLQQTLSSFEVPTLRLCGVTS
jgi:hypothetical protein